MHEMKDNSVFFRINKIEGKSFLSFDLDTMKKYDQIACGALKLETPDFIMPVLFEKGPGIITLRYSVPENYVALEEFTGSLMIEDVLKLYQWTMYSLEECGDWYLKPEAFCFDTSHVYISEKHERLVFAYIPDDRTQLDVQGIKSIFISLLEKCNETSGGNIQLQLYKYFYKPKFSLEEFRKMVDKFNEDVMHKQQAAPAVEVKKVVEPTTPPVVTKETKVAPTPAVKPAEEVPEKPIEKVVLIEKEEPVETYSAKTSKPVEVEEANPRSVYAAQPNRSQLSQEEIEEMVKSIYSSKPLEPVEKKVAEEASVYGTKGSSIARNNSFNEEEDEEESFYSSKSKEAMSGSSPKKKNLFDNVFSTPTKNTRTSNSSTERRRGPVLKSISTHTRYDLPKVIPLDFEDDQFIIGRATRTGEETGAHYEFGAEITPISRMHAEIQRQDDLYYLKDLGSSNGTFLNGTKIEPNKAYQIEEGDKIAFAIAFSKNSIEYMFVE